MVREETLLKLVNKINELINITQAQATQIKHMNIEINKLRCSPNSPVYVGLADLENLPKSDALTVEVPKVPSTTEGLYSINLRK